MCYVRGASLARGYKPNRGGTPPPTIQPMNQKELQTKRRKDHEESKERWQYVLNMRQMGMTLEEIAKKIDRTKERVRQILKKYEEKA